MNKKGSQKKPESNKESRTHLSKEIATGPNAKETDNKDKSQHYSRNTDRIPPDAAQAQKNKVRRPSGTSGTKGPSELGQDRRDKARRFSGRTGEASEAKQVSKNNVYQPPRAANARTPAIKGRDRRENVRRSSGDPGRVPPEMDRNRSRSETASSENEWIWKEKIRRYVVSLLRATGPLTEDRLHSETKSRFSNLHPSIGSSQAEVLKTVYNACSGSVTHKDGLWQLASKRSQQRFKRNQRGRASAQKNAEPESEKPLTKNSTSNSHAKALPDWLPPPMESTPSSTANTSKRSYAMVVSGVTSTNTSRPMRNAAGIGVRQMSLNQNVAEDYVETSANNMLSLKCNKTGLGLANQADSIFVDYKSHVQIEQRQQPDLCGGDARTYLKNQPAEGSFLAVHEPLDITINASFPANENNYCEVNSPYLLQNNTDYYNSHYEVPHSNVVENSVIQNLQSGGDTVLPSVHRIDRTNECKPETHKPENFGIKYDRDSNYYMKYNSWEWPKESVENGPYSVHLADASQPSEYPYYVANTDMDFHPISRSNCNQYVPNSAPQTAVYYPELPNQFPNADVSYESSFNSPLAEGTSSQIMFKDITDPLATASRSLVPYQQYNSYERKPSVLQQYGTKPIEQPASGRPTYCLRHMQSQNTQRQFQANPLWSHTQDQQQSFFSADAPYFQSFERERRPSGTPEEVQWYQFGQQQQYNGFQEQKQTTQCLQYNNQPWSWHVPLQQDSMLPQEKPTVLPQQFQNYGAQQAEFNLQPVQPNVYSQIQNHQTNSYMQFQQKGNGHLLPAAQVQYQKHDLQPCNLIYNGQLEEIKPRRFSSTHSLYHSGPEQSLLNSSVNSQRPLYSVQLEKMTTNANQEENMQSPFEKRYDASVEKQMYHLRLDECQQDSESKSPRSESHNKSSAQSTEQSCEPQHSEQQHTTPLEFIISPRLQQPNFASLQKQEEHAEIGIRNCVNTEKQIKLKVLLVEDSKELACKNSINSTVQQPNQGAFEAETEEIVVDKNKECDDVVVLQRVQQRLDWSHHQSEERLDLGRQGTCSRNRDQTNTDNDSAQEDKMKGENLHIREEREDVDSTTDSSTLNASGSGYLTSPANEDRENTAEADPHDSSPHTSELDKTRKKSTHSIHIISKLKESQVAVNKLFKEEVLGVDCEGLNLFRKNALSLLQIATKDDVVYIFDLLSPCRLMDRSGLRQLLESNKVVKVFHDCRCDSAALYIQYDITMQNVFDTQVAHQIILQQENGLIASEQKQESLNALCDKYGTPKNHCKVEVKIEMKKNKRYWDRRPLTSQMIDYAASDVLALVPHLYTALRNKIHEDMWKDFGQGCEDYVYNRIDSGLTDEQREARTLEIELQTIKNKLTHQNRPYLSRREVQLLVSGSVDLSDVDLHERVECMLQKLKDVNMPWRKSRKEKILPREVARETEKLVQNWVESGRSFDSVREHNRRVFREVEPELNGDVSDDNNQHSKFCGPQQENTVSEVYSFTSVASTGEVNASPRLLGGDDDDEDWGKEKAAEAFHWTGKMVPLHVLLERTGTEMLNKPKTSSPPPPKKKYTHCPKGENRPFKKHSKDRKIAQQPG